MRRPLLVFAALSFACSTSRILCAFGPEGHAAVGEIAEQVLANNPPVAQKVRGLLHHLPLSQAAKIADDIKHWNRQPVPNLAWTQEPTLCAEMADFLLANSNNHGGSGHNHFDHHSFHYTDISVVSDLKYDAHKRGANDQDIVHMINYCITVLQGTAPQPNQFRITPTVAVILLAHYLGDVAQPLHVGAAYFDSQGNLVDPDTDPSTKADQGGNQIQLRLNGSHANTLELHGFWDSNAVHSAFARINQAAGAPGHTLSPQILQAHFVTIQPSGAPLDQGVPLDKLAETWANEMLPIAKEAHDRLTITVLANPIQLSNGNTLYWRATEAQNLDSYTDFAAGVVEKSIHRAGWRLAALLQATVP